MHTLSDTPGLPYRFFLLIHGHGEESRRRRACASGEVADGERTGVRAGPSGLQIQPVVLAPALNRVWARTASACPIPPAVLAAHVLVGAERNITQRYYAECV